MNCGKCGGRTFVDRVFSENKNYETFCILCGERKFINKNSRFGKWLDQVETAREAAAGRS